MRVYTTKKTIVDLKHFRFCAKHYQLLLTLQQEVPNLKLEVNDTKDEPRFVPINIVDLENMTAIGALNPNDVQRV